MIWVSPSLFLVICLSIYEMSHINKSELTIRSCHQDSIIGENQLQDRSFGLLVVISYDVGSLFEVRIDQCPFWYIFCVTLLDLRIKLGDMAIGISYHKIISMYWVNSYGRGRILSM